MKYTPLYLLRKALTWWGWRRIDRMMDMLGSVEEGRELMDLASEKDVSLWFDKKLYKQGVAAEIRNPTARHGKTPHIALNPFLSTKALTLSLAHELRHLWQVQQLEKPQQAGNLSYKTGIAYIRFMEADAYVFQNYMALKIRKATGRHLPYNTTPDKSRLWEFVTGGSKPERDALTATGLKKLFDNFQSSAHVDGYDRKTLEVFNEAAAYFKRTAAWEPTQDQLDNKVREHFNRASLKEVGSLAKVAVIGKGADAIRYLGDFENEPMLDSLWAKVGDRTVLQGQRKYGLS